MRATRNEKRDIAFYQSVKRDMCRWKIRFRDIAAESNKYSLSNLTKSNTKNDTIALSTSMISKKRLYDTFAACAT